MFSFHRTCEHVHPDAFIGQPFSFSVNILTILLILCLFVRTYHAMPYTALVLSVVAFELFHALCHARPHLLKDPDRMVDMTHAMFLVSIMTLVWIISECSSDIYRSYWFWGVLGILVISDLFIWSTFRGTRMILSGIVMAMFLTGCIVLPHWKRYKWWIMCLTLLFVLGAILLQNEKQWCTPHFPLHVMTELILCLILLTTLYLIRECSRRGLRGGG